MASLMLSLTSPAPQMERLHQGYKLWGDDEPVAAGHKARRRKLTQEAVLAKRRRVVLTSGSVAACMARHVPVQGLSMPLPTESELATQLFEAARARAKQHGLEIRPDATSQLRTLTKSGAQKILAAANAKPAEAQEAYIRGAVRVATEAVSALVDEMTSARFRIPDYINSHPDSIGEDTLKEALNLLCPLWPFC
jgi:hypothetical protein